MLNEQIARNSEIICSNILELPAFTKAQEVLLYMPIRKEVDVSSLLQGLWDRGVRVLLPRCSADAPGVMDLACVNCFTDITPGKFNIPEPNPETCTPIQDACPDIALVPAVGYDRRGYRLGYGGGYYDRFLSAPNMQQCLLVGVAHSLQIMQEIPHDSWDIPVHIIITENERIEVRQ